MLVRCRDIFSGQCRFVALGRRFCSIDSDRRLLACADLQLCACRSYTLGHEHVCLIVHWSVFGAVGRFSPYGYGLCLVRTLRILGEPVGQCRMDCGRGFGSHIRLVRSLFCLFAFTQGWRGKAKDLACQHCGFHFV